MVVLIVMMSGNYDNGDDNDVDKGGDGVDDDTSNGSIQKCYRRKFHADFFFKYLPNLFLAFN